MYSCQLHSEQEREANIARNRALLSQLDLTLDIPKKRPAPKEKTKAKPVQPAKKRVKREPAPVAPLRQSTRLRRRAPDPDETPEKKRKREVRFEGVSLQQCLTHSGCFSKKKSFFVRSKTRSG